METDPRFVRHLERRVQRYIRQHRLFADDGPVLVAVSGGPDSTALLLLLSCLRPELSVDLQVAHFDHMLRGGEAAAEDIAFVSHLAATLGLPLVSGQADVREHAHRHKLSLEEAARQLRYQFLGQVAGQVGAPAVATGHTADDQAETVLLHLLRGSGIDGLAGMRPRTAWPLGGTTPVVVRPLLAVSRAETEAYCRHRGITPRLDTTNQWLQPLRNRIRHELLPRLRQYNPAVGRALYRLGESAAIDSDYLNLKALESWGDIAESAKERITLRRERLAPLHSALRRRILRRAIENLAGQDVDLKSYHLRTAEAAIDTAGSFSLSLPHGLTLTATQERLTIARPGLPHDVLPPQTPLAVPGGARYGGWAISAHVVGKDAFQVDGDPYQAFLDFDEVGDKLLIRARQPGDRFRPLGMVGVKKLQDFLVDAKVPRNERDEVPLVCSERGIIWVVGHRIADDAKVTAATKRVLHLRFSDLAGAGAI